jgi:hypothetical protein
MTVLYEHTTSHTIHQVIKYDFECPCFLCGRLIPVGCFGLVTIVTIVSEGYAWCFECAQSRIRDIPELKEAFKKFEKEHETGKCRPWHLTYELGKL